MPMTLTRPDGLLTEGGGFISTVTQTVKQAGATDGELVAANPDRRYLLIVNLSDEVVYVNLNGDEAKTTTGLPLDPSGGGFIELAMGYGNLTCKAIRAIHGGTGAKNLLVVEGV